jgi:NADH-quinone oxidoreductase subunit E
MTATQHQLDPIIHKFKGKKGMTIPLLQEVQNLEGYLSKDSMRYVSENSEISLAEIYGVATFYTMFRLKPQGRHIIRICKGTACHVSGAAKIVDAIRSELKLVGEEDSTDDGRFTVMEVACLGCCSLAPVIMINDKTFGKLAADKISSILDKFE